MHDGPVRTRTKVEILLVLGLSLGRSAVYAIVNLISTLTQGPLRSATATLNRSVSPRPWLDLTYQLLNIGFALVPVALALFLLTPRSADEPAHRSADEPTDQTEAELETEPGWRRIGFDLRAPGRDLLTGAGLAVVIGVPGLGLYFAGRALGVTATVVPAALGTHWWTVPVLVLAAAQNAIVEEVIVVGYLFTRLRELTWRPWVIVTVSALLRGSYHLYQGFGPFAANAVMGVIFGLVYLRTKRVMPLVIAHTVLDVVAFVGYALFRSVLNLPG